MASKILGIPTSQHTVTRLPTNISTYNIVNPKKLYPDLEILREFSYVYVPFFRMCLKRLRWQAILPVGPSC